MARHHPQREELDVVLLVKPGALERLQRQPGTQARATPLPAWGRCDARARSAGDANHKGLGCQGEWSQLVNQVFGRQKRVLVEKSGIPVAALVSADDLKRLQRLEAQEAEDVRILQASRAALRDVPDEELEREVDRAFQEARERHRSQAATEHRARIL